MEGGRSWECDGKAENSGKNTWEAVRGMLGFGLKVEFMSKVGPFCDEKRAI
jgi:hypothetical protein